MPGVIDTSSNYVEHPELVAERITRYATLVGRERVLATTDCGFASFATFLAVSPKLAWAKLASLVQGADLASAAFWQRTVGRDRGGLRPGRNADVNADTLPGFAS
jgi:5-methyltetrahydropteroyltriglutamate--homocysteine methyltransferase